MKTEETKTERAYSWDEEPIENPQESTFALLPEGVYPFVITKFERGRHEGSDKLSPCPKAIINCEVDGGEYGVTTVKNNLFLHTKCEGLLCAFFHSIGHRKHGEPLRMDWSRVVGSRGICKIGIRKYDGRDYSEIKSFLEPSAEKNVIPF